MIKPGATSLKEDAEEFDNGSSSDPERRMKTGAEEYEQRRRKEPDPADRRKNTERSFLEGPDNQVRGSLEQWYDGKCQICKRTFPDKAGDPVFFAKYIVERKHARQVDNQANALCLCADHFAKWQYGALVIEDFPDQIKSIKLRNEGGDGNYQIHIKLCGEDCDIKYNEKHISLLKALINVTENQREKETSSE